VILEPDAVLLLLSYADCLVAVAVAS